MGSWIDVGSLQSYCSARIQRKGLVVQDFMAFQGELQTPTGFMSYHKREIFISIENKEDLSYIIGI